MEPNPGSSYRAVLIGIDDYPRKKPLNGCVNDIDQIERILFDRLKVPSERITRFAAPRAGVLSSTRLPSLKPTRDEIRNFLNHLAQEVGPDDLVFLYYSGHGSQVMTMLNGQRIAREALIPVDHWNDGGLQRLLYDFELNGLLARIAKRAGDLTVVLDCCRGGSSARNIAKSRYLEIEGLQNLNDEFPPDLMTQDSSGQFPLGSTPLLVTACRTCEGAYETTPEESLRPHGVFTFSLIQALNASERPLSELRWSDLWTTLLDQIGHFTSLQHPQLVGRWERRIFGGPWTQRDAGYVVRQNGDHFRIEAGTLAGLSEGAEVAVYGPEPDLLPEFGSRADSRARIGLLRVKSADRSFCTAVSINGSLCLPTAARGRLVRPGNPDRLILSVEPFSLDLARDVQEYKLVAIPAGQPEAEAFLRCDENGWFHLGDMICGAGGDPQRPPLASFPSSSPVALERVLEHHARYVQTLRLPSRCRDLIGAIHVELLDCQDMATAGDLQAPDLPQLAFDATWGHKVRDGDGFAIRIENRADSLLYVTVLNCTGSGRVEYLGDVGVPPGFQQVLWREGILGSPFDLTVGADRESVVNRLVFVGTTLPDRDLRFLILDNSFAEFILRNRDAGMRSTPNFSTEKGTSEFIYGARDTGTSAPNFPAEKGTAKCAEFVRGVRDAGPRSTPNFPVEKWTAEMVTLRIYK